MSKAQNSIIRRFDDPSSPIAANRAFTVTFIIQNWMLILLAAASGGLLLWHTLQKTTGGGVPSTEAVRLINREKGVLIDIRDPAEFAAGHCVGARSIPLARLDGAKDLPSNKALPLVLVCATGSRAARAAGQLRKLGYEQATVLNGGLAAWREAGLPVEKSA